MENENKPGNFWPGFFLGGLFGAILLFLWGTKEGKKITKLLAEKGELLEEDIENKLSELEDKGEKIVGDVQKQTVKKIAQKIVGEVKEKLNSPTSPKKFFRKAGKSLTS